MRTIITLIAAAAFVLHLTLGCCAHHAHAVEGSVCSEHASTVHHNHGCKGHGGNSHSHGSHDHDSQPPADGPADEECPGHHCNAGHCAFMAAGKTVIAKDTYLAVLPLFVAAPLTHVSISPRISATISNSGRLIAPPVRTHLFNQVLLI